MPNLLKRLQSYVQLGWWRSTPASFIYGQPELKIYITQGKGWRKQVTIYC